MNQHRRMCLYGYLNIKHRASLLANFNFTDFMQYCRLCVVTQLNNPESSTQEHTTQTTI